MLGCRIRDKVQAIAYICMFEVNPITPEDEELLVYLCKIIYHEMLYTGETAMQRNPVFSIVCDLLEGNIGYQEYLNRSSYANLRIPKKLRLLVLDYDKNQIGLSIYYIHRVLSEGLNHIFSVIYHEQILLAMDERLWNQTVADSILEHLQNYNIRLAVSYPLDDIMMLPNAYVQANNALRIGHSLNPERKFYAYEDYALQDFLQAAANHISLGVHIHPWVKLLESYDAANDTELSKTLSCYLEQHKRAGKTAQKLFIHRSTLYARLEKITDLLDIPALDDIEDDLFLRLSFCISRYC